MTTAGSVTAAGSTAAGSTGGLTVGPGGSDPAGAAGSGEAMAAGSGAATAAATQPVRLRSYQRGTNRCRGTCSTAASQRRSRMSATAPIDRASSAACAVQSLTTRAAQEGAEEL